MIIVKSKSGVPVRLTRERWRHIEKRHPEMEEQKDKVLQTLTSPDLIQAGDLDTLMATKHYTVTPLTEKFLVVVYKEFSKRDGFILTAYFTKELSQRRSIIWKP